MKLLCLDVDNIEVLEGIFRLLCKRETITAIGVIGKRLMRQYNVEIVLRHKRLLYLRAASVSPYEQLPKVLRAQRMLCYCCVVNLLTGG